jgi:hypothetical protein
LVSCGFQLLGSLKITFDDEEFTKVMSGAKVRLLAYLVLAIDMPQRRKKIAFDYGRTPPRNKPFPICGNSFTI